MRKVRPLQKLISRRPIPKIIVFVPALHVLLAIQYYLILVHFSIASFLKTVLKYLNIIYNNKYNGDDNDNNFYIQSSALHREPSVFVIGLPQG